MNSVLQQFHCRKCGNVNWIHTYSHRESEEEFCVQCNGETTHEKYNSKGR